MFKKAELETIEIIFKVIKIYCFLLSCLCVYVSIIWVWGSEKSWFSSILVLNLGHEAGVVSAFTRSHLASSDRLWAVQIKVSFLGDRVASMWFFSEGLGNSYPNGSRCIVTRPEAVALFGKLLAKGILRQRFLYQKPWPVVSHLYLTGQSWRASDQASDRFYLL